MSRVLITGMSAVGKSTVVEELSLRGYVAVDLDDPAWSRYGRIGSNAEAEWLWREDRVSDLLDSAARPLFVAGCAANQGQFRSRFDRIVLLTVSVEVTLQRLASRRSNDFGKSEAERAKVLADKASVEPLLRAVAHVVIDTDRPLGDVVDAVIDAGLG